MERRTAITLIPSISIFISGYSPLFLIMIIKNINSIVWYHCRFQSEITGPIEIDFPIWFIFNNPIAVSSLAVVSGLSLVLLSYVLKNISSHSFEITVSKAKSRSSEVVNYTIPYMISFVAFDLGQWQDLLSLFLFLGMLCLLSIRSQSIFINPILAALGYGLYDCSYIENEKVKECIMLSQIDMSAGDVVSHKKLSNYMSIIRK